MIVVFDIETLGLDAFQNQIVLIGMKIAGKTALSLQSTYLLFSIPFLNIKHATNSLLCQC